MSFLFSADYEVRKNGISPAQNMAAYLGGPAIQTVGDNPVTAYASWCSSTPRASMVRQ